MQSSPPMTAVDRTVLRTDRLILRHACPSDLDAFFAIYSDPHALRYWSSAPHTDRAQTQKKLDRMMSDAARGRVFVIERDGRAIGHVGADNHGEVGFLFHPDHWRHGIVSEAMRALIPHLFVGGLTRLTADADPRNAASIGLLTSLGFTETHRADRTYCIAGEWSDSVYFTLDRP